MAREESRFEEVTDEVWCDVHGCVHAKTDDPFNYGFHEDGNEEEPECGPDDWRVLWAGRRVGK